MIHDYKRNAPPRCLPRSGRARPLHDPASSPRVHSLSQRREGFFSTITRRHIRRGVFKSAPDLERVIAAYIREHNETANPFPWAKPVETILAKLSRLPVLTSESGH